MFISDQNFIAKSNINRNCIFSSPWEPKHLHVRLFPLCLKLKYPYILINVSISWFKGQLQRFHKLISNDRIWPSEQGFFWDIGLQSQELARDPLSVSLVFRNNNWKTFVCDVTSDQSSLISTERIDLRDRKASENCQVWWFLEKIMVHCAAYDCLVVVGRPNAFPPTNFKQITKEGSKL